MGTKRNNMEDSLSYLVHILKLLRVTGNTGDVITRSRHYFPRRQVDTYIARMIKLQGRYSHGD